MGDYTLEYRRFFRYILPVLLWMGLIFILSDQDKLRSAQHNVLVLWILETFGIDLDALTGGHASFIIRKTAHFTEYFILYLWVHRALKAYHIRSFTRYAWLITVFYACTDEVHQTYVPGRVGSPIDVGIDALGATLAMGLLSIRKTKRTS